MVTYGEFVQRVRRHRPSDIVAACGAQSATIPPGELDDRGRPPVMPHFALAGIARAALVCGNEHRSRPVTLGDLREMSAMFVNITDPFVFDRDLKSFFVRTGAEQFPWQARPFWDVARTRALLVDAASATTQCVITPSTWSNLLGCSLEEFAGVAMLLHTAAIQNRGTWDQRWLEQTNFQPVFRMLPRSAIERVVGTQFVLSQDCYRTKAKAHPINVPGLERYSFNPLLAGPFIEVGANLPTAPATPAILFRATPGSLYYTALEKHGLAFAHALGPVYETYVGRQLELCNPELLICDREYEPGKRAVDFIVVLPRAVVLVEAKATRLTQESRLGGAKLDSDYARTAGRGMAQIEATARLIRERHRAFHDVPFDRPCLGLVVTLEPYYGCTSEVMQPVAQGLVPKWLANIRELEQLVSLRDKAFDDAMLDLAQDGTGGGSVQSAIMQGNVGRNRILDEAWARYPFGNP